jgi:hypothetical protein
MTDGHLYVVYEVKGETFVIVYDPMNRLYKTFIRGLDFELPFTYRDPDNGKMRIDEKGLCRKRFKPDFDDCVKASELFMDNCERMLKETSQKIISEVIMSERANASIHAECLSHGDMETGGILLGHIRDGVAYIVEAIGPGIDATHTPNFYACDARYHNHLLQKVGRVYEDIPELIGLWHRHPGSLDTFSGTDLGTNEEFRKASGGTCISMLVNFDPDFRMTSYAINVDSYEKVPTSVDEKKMEGLLNIAEPDVLSERAEEFRRQEAYRKEIVGGFYDG